MFQLFKGKQRCMVQLPCKRGFRFTVNMKIMADVCGGFFVHWFAAVTFT